MNYSAFLLLEIKIALFLKNVFHFWVAQLVKLPSPAWVMIPELGDWAPCLAPCQTRSLFKILSPFSPLPILSPSLQPQNVFHYLKVCLSICFSLLVLKTFQNSVIFIIFFVFLSFRNQEKAVEVEVIVK